MFVIIFGHRSFGKCDYFKLGNEDSDEDFYVRTQFFHISFLPLCPLKSYIGKDDKVYMVLPDPSGRSILWAWARCLPFFGLLACLAALTFIIIHHTYGEHKAVWQFIVPSVVAVFLLILVIGSQFYKPKATEERRAEYIALIMERRDRIAAARGAGQRVPTVRATQGQSNVQAQMQAKPAGPPAGSGPQPPTYGYDQAPIQNFPGLPSAPPLQFINASHSGNIV